jgi:hypothetical protein
MYALPLVGSAYEQPSWASTCREVDVAAANLAGGWPAVGLLNSCYADLALIGPLLP